MAENTEKKKTFFKYSEAQLALAISDVRNNVCSIRQAERTYNVPHSTLINKLKGKTPEMRKMGPPTIMTREEEELLVRWISACASKGFPLNKRLLCETVKDVIDSDNRPNPFKDGLPGSKWFKAFLKRHPEVSQRHAESINTGRACVSENSLRHWHGEIRKYLASENAEDILEDPTRIFNSDESGFATNPKTGLVLGPKGMKNFYEIKSGSEKECITALFTISADGQIYPPMIVFPYARIPAEIVRNTNPDWVIGRSKKGWMSSQTFYSYVCNTFLPHLKGKGVKLPILYLLDGHKSHLTYNLSKFCAENGIFLYALFPNATHIIQPADVSLFAPLKCNWKKIVFDWRKANNNKCVNKATFPVLLENAAQQVTADTVKNGFRKCGIYPYNVEAIDFTKCMQGTSRTLGENEEEKLKPTEFKISHFLYFESVIPSKRRKEFRETEMGEWVGDESSKELFEVWKKLKSRCTKNKEEEERSDTDTEQELLTVENRNTEIYESTENDPNVIPTHEISEVNKNREEVNIDKTDVRKDATKIYETGNHQTIIVETEKQATVHEEISENLEQRKESTTEEINQESRIIIHSNVVQTRPTTPTLTNNNPQKHQNQTISTSFIDHIFWPEESPQKNDSCRKKERLPHATTSLRWLQYHEDKEKLKMQKEEAKREKAMLRKKKKEEKLEKAETKLVKGCRKRKVKQRYDSESEEHEDWSESGTSIDDISDEHFTSDSDNETLAKIAKREEPCSSHTENESLAKIAKADERCLKGDFYLVSFPGKKKSHNYVCCIQNIFSSNEVEVQALCATGEDRSTYKIIENDISTVDIEQLLYKLEEPKIIGTGNRRRYKFSSEIM